MTIVMQSHGGRQEAKDRDAVSAMEAAPPTGTDIAVDEQADFGYFVPPQDGADNYLPESGETIGELDELGNLMIEVVADADGAENTGTDSNMPPVLTYWGQFLDHELTARTDRETILSNIQNPHPPVSSSIVESQLRNARSPRFDLDSVYGGSPLGTGITADVVKVIAGLRHPTLVNKMRIGTAVNPGPLPDGLDEHRDLPRYVQVQASVRNAALALARKSMSQEQFAQFSSTLPQRALIGDTRNDENLIVAQFHLSFLRFHNKAVDFLESHNTGWIPDFASAQTLTRLHYQWLIVRGYLKGICDPAVVDGVVADRASHFFKFRAEFDARRQNSRLGNALPLEFSVAAYRFGHSMVRAFYDYNKNFGRSGGILGEASFDLLFDFTGGGTQLEGSKRIPKNWVIDWSRFVGLAPHDGTDGLPARVARKIDTELAPPLNEMAKEGNDETDEQIRALFKSLARRNLRRGYNLRLPTGQAVHAYLKQQGAVQSAPIADVSTLFNSKPQLRDFLRIPNPSSSSALRYGSTS